MAEINDTDWLRSLRARKKKLAAEIHKLTKELKALEALDAPASQETPTPKRKASGRRGDFRNKIRQVVKDSDHPIQAADVVKHLETQGFKMPNLKGRISTELYKLRMAGQVKLTEHGYVWIGQ